MQDAGHQGPTLGGPVLDESTKTAKLRNIDGPKCQAYP